MSNSKYVIYPYNPCPLDKAIDVTALHTAFIHSMPVGYSSLSESHNFWELILVLEGTTAVVSDDEAFNLSKNNLLIHAPNVFHRHYNSDSKKNRYAILSFSADNMPLGNNTLLHLSINHANEFINIIKLIRSQYETDRICILEKKKNARILIDQEVKSRIEFFLSSIMTPQYEGKKKTNSTYQKITSYLSDNINRSLTVPTIARELNMSVPNLKKVFKLYSGVGVMKYFNQLKFDKACSLLGAGYSVKEVSDMLAFTSQSAFSTAFKNATGLPPSKWENIT